MPVNVTWPRFRVYQGAAFRVESAYVNTTPRRRCGTQHIQIAVTHETVVHVVNVVDAGVEHGYGNVRHRITRGSIVAN